MEELVWIAGFVGGVIVVLAILLLLGKPKYGGMGVIETERYLSSSQGVQMPSLQKSAMLCGIKENLADGVKKFAATCSTGNNVLFKKQYPDLTTARIAVRNFMESYKQS